MELWIIVNKDINFEASAAVIVNVVFVLVCCSAV
jgi:hypothetical protein